MMSNELEKQSEIVDAILIMVMILIILNPVVCGIQIDIIPACLYAVAYYRRNNFLQTFLDGSIIGLAAIRSNSFLPLLLVSLFIVALYYSLIKLFDKFKFNISIKSGIIVYIGTIIGGLAYVILKPGHPTLQLVLLITIVRGFVNSLLAVVFNIIYFYILKKIVNKKKKKL